MHQTTAHGTLFCKKRSKQEEKEKAPFQIYLKQFRMHD